MTGSGPPPVIAATRRSAAARAADRARDWAPPVLLLVGGLVAWELVVRVFGIKQFILPSPIAIAVAWQTYLPELFAAARYTFVEILAGLVIGATAGIVVGAITARFRSMQDSLMPFAVAASSVPILAFAPLFNNWFGLDQQLSKAMVAAALCFFPVMINTLRGLTSVHPSSIELMQSYAAGRLSMFRRVRIPNALPHMFTGLKVATVLSMIGAIVGEYFGGPIEALGVKILNDSSYGNFTDAWAGIVMASLLGIVFYAVVALAERLTTSWHPSARAFHTE